MTKATHPLADAAAICRLSAAALSAAFARREISPVEAAQATLDRAEEINPAFNAFAFLDRPGALESAAASERRWREGAPLSPIDGVPTTLKDIVWVAGWRISSGSALTPDQPCAADAPAVAGLREAGAVFIGATTTPEFGWKALTDSPRFGVTRNPWNASLTPGGSSGGAAVAAATGAGALHLGTDGGGSIRIPAAFTGIAGLKPSFGRVAAYPASAFGTLAHVGPMARDVADLRLMLPAMSGRDARDWWQGPGALPSLDAPELAIERLRVGVWTHPPAGPVDPQIAAAFARAVAQLGADGAQLVEADLDAPDLLEVFNALWFSGAAARTAQIGGDRARLDPGLAEIVAEGDALSGQAYLAATRRRAEFGAELDALFDDLDIVISPASAVLPFAAGEETPPDLNQRRWTEWAGFSFPVNLGQHPACVVPIGRSSDGLPIALQVIAARGQDALAMRAAELLQTRFCS